MGLNSSLSFLFFPTFEFSDNSNPMPNCLEVIRKIFVHCKIMFANKHNHSMYSCMHYQTFTDAMHLLLQIGLDRFVAFVSMREDVSLFHKCMAQHLFHITLVCHWLLVSFQRKRFQSNNYDNWQLLVENSTTHSLIVPRKRRVPQLKENHVPLSWSHITQPRNWVMLYECENLER